MSFNSMEVWEQQHYNRQDALTSQESLDRGSTYREALEAIAAIAQEAYNLHRDGYYLEILTIARKELAS